MIGSHKLPVLQVAEDRWDKASGVVKIPNVFLQKEKLHKGI